MRRLLLDTSAYSHLMRGNRQAVRILDDAAEVFLSATVIGELLAGFKQGSRELENRAVLNDFLSVTGVGTVGLDEETAERYALILDYLKKRGMPIPANDIWIAASAMQHGLVLLTADRHFTELPQIVVEYLSSCSG
jgi:predicted nucleic acid-binding protein